MVTSLQNLGKIYYFLCGAKLLQSHCIGRIRKDQCTNSCNSCGSKECKGKDSRHPSYPCEFLLRAQNDDKST